ncbi:hypothetical protein Hanom_Chr15g01383501 [Helianthus anomalus]
MEVTSLRLAMEPLCKVCKIVAGQRYLRKLSQRQITAHLKVTCQCLGKEIRVFSRFTFVFNRLSLFFKHRIPYVYFSCWLQMLCFCRLPVKKIMARILML